VESHLRDGAAIGTLEPSEEALAGIGAALTDVASGEDTMTARLARRAENEAEKRDVKAPAKAAGGGLETLATVLRAIPEWRPGSAPEATAPDRI
jgi:hypothetical protein